MTDKLDWPKQDAPPTFPRDPYNAGRWPGMDYCPLMQAGKRHNRRPYRHARNKG